MAPAFTGGKLVRLDLKIPEDIVGRYATNIVIQHTENEFIISFFEAIPPPILGTDEEREAKLDQTDHIDARCVARIVVSPQRMPGFIQALQGNYEKYLEKLTADE